MADMKTRLVAKVVTTVMLAIWAGLAPAHAGSSDFQVLARMLHFIEGVPDGERTVGVVIDPAVPGAVTAAEELKAAFGTGKTFENITLTAKAISPSEIGSVDIVFVPEGLSKHHAMISAEAQKKGALTITNDPACVESQDCVISVRRRARTEILWSRGAAQRASVGLGETLKALVEERP
ncbi:YfiR family protein [Parvularcula lutaonensis]|uniref:DUF4154 domain-containing protein n=1 Tax=Parvularcula lutaonensis TaxID=491923 RepID=A0ABV7MA26_9PROT|nr:hypothetical protein [Parvularcula lutaonensis]GGY43959.1 hypothetical protein GCM10007148_11010 [Parvularcula lutaonensis]